MDIETRFLLMIRLFKKIASWFGYVDKSTIPILKLATGYSIATNANPFDISDLIMNDLKDQTYRKLKEDKEFLEWVNDIGLIDVHFMINVPIGVTIDAVHLFYWDGETLFSMTKESKEMTRASAIDSILS